MTKEEAAIQIKAAAYRVAAEVGWREAVKLLQEVAAELEAGHWSGPENR